MNPNAMLNWGPSDSYDDGWNIGSEDDNGGHIRGTDGWPYSIYRRSRQIGGCDTVIAHGIQCKDDADALCVMLNSHWAMHHAR